ncbi:hypothetical protein TRM7557_03748 [Tritonibacter multivorans]|uniref:Uncharacterized protein n=2 Tax=Tritonibacter multivorans TaxID=928856 RepID=A0A0N7M127_9RHOB|nr:hypothetical protein [Tritonibacter multivorans]MDA7421605.1 hypothetical protein [Tritonibacter multivorans]CUH82097.1 hypothetical protein TRM7557_03748 [Tritonibacter multivorans]SFC94159.1 hypothetical protein SAMN04488049_10594 [Tritonibacter multivorans]
MTQRMDRLAWTPEQGPSAALVDHILQGQGARPVVRLGLKSTFVVSGLGVLSGLGAGLALKSQMASGLDGAALLFSPVGLYACLMCLTAAGAAMSGKLPRLREFSFLSAVAIAATLMS